MIAFAPRPARVGRTGPGLERPDAVLGLCAALLGTLPACRDLERFDTTRGGAYCGSMVSAPSFQEAFLPDSIPQFLQLGMTLDTSQLNSQPGFVFSDDATRGLCSSNGQPLFNHAPMRAIPKLQNDVLSTLEFGEGHEHDFFVWIDSSCQGTMVGVVSLMKNDDVELRLFKPEPLPALDAPADKRPGFALFHLLREAQGCAF